MRHKHFWGILILCLFFAWALPASAQTGGYAILSQPDYDQFPEITTYLDIYDQNDVFMSDLSQDDISLTENGMKRPLTEFKRLSPGIQLVIAINIGPPFAIQDISGRSRWDYLSEHLAEWLETGTNGGKDDLSIISNDGLETTHTDKRALLEVLENYQPQPRETSPNLNVLSRAIDLAMDPTPELGMKPVVLLLTPPPVSEEIAALQNITSRARDGNVRVFSWLISSPDFFDSPGAGELQNMSQETRGKFFAFSGSEDLPHPGDLFDALRGTYLIKYNSKIQSPGPHRLELTVNTEQGKITTSRDISLSITPPNPILVPPPQEIERKNPTPDDESTPTEEYSPTSLTLEAIIEFPDGHPRTLQQTTLMVNGEPAVINHSPPYDQFTWDLSPYESDQTYYLSIQAVDSLGLSRTSVQTPVEITVVKPEPTISNIFEQNSMGFLSLAGILISALVLFVLVTRGVIKPKSLLPAASPRNQPRKGRTRENAQRIAKSWNMRRLFTFPKKPTQERKTLIGNLEPYNDEAKNLFPYGIPLHKSKTSFGSNPKSAVTYLNHESVSERHASLIAQSEKEFFLKDHGTQAGTWVNFQQIPHGHDVSIHHGDIIHFGKIGFILFSANPDVHRDVIITEEKGS